ncbi:hypothetical protein [Cupriavidus sp. YR651]|nr:hypothetical protein [Cupriavidus sp. YR651]
MVRILNTLKARDAEQMAALLEKLILEIRRKLPARARLKESD